MKKLLTTAMIFLCLSSFVNATPNVQGDPVKADDVRGDPVKAEGATGSLK